MKTKYIILSALLSIFYLQSFAANTYTINQNNVISLTSGYVDNMNETWNVVSTVTNKPLIITYNMGTESGFDFVKINSVDNSGNVTNLLTLSGSKSGTISTAIPNGKAQIVFTSDGSVSYASNPSVYTGVNISFSVDNSNIISGNMLVTGDLQTNANGLVNGKLGIGLTNPTKKLEIYEGIGGRFSFSGANCTSGYEIAQTVDNTGYKINVGSAIRDYRISMYGSDKLTIQNGGNVGIGTTNPDQKLTVNGSIHAKEVIIDLAVPADYVFKPTYKLMPLYQVEQYVNTNSHLPEIPSAAEIVKKGLSMGEMQNKLLQKVEELTLYIIQQQKEIDLLKKNQ